MMKKNDKDFIKYLEYSDQLYFYNQLNSDDKCQFKQNTMNTLLYQVFCMLCEVERMRDELIGRLDEAMEKLDEAIKK